MTAPYSLFHGFDQLGDVSYFIVEMIGVDVITEQQASNAILVHFTTNRQVRQHLVDAQLELLLARFFRQLKELCPGRTKHCLVVETVSISSERKFDQQYSF